MNTLLLHQKLDRIEKLLSGYKEILTLEEACEYAGISRSYLYKLTSTGKIPCSKPNGKLIYFEKSKLNIWLLQNPIIPNKNTTITTD